MAGVPGFEPGHDGIKTRCLTAWLYPINKRWGGRGELNPRVPESQSGALTTSPRPPSYNLKLAGAVGIEPTSEVLETSVLPLNYAPKNWWWGADSNCRTRRSGFTVRRV